MRAKEVRFVEVNSFDFRCGMLIDRLPLGSGIKAVLTEQLLEKLSQGLFLRMRDAVDRCSLQAGVEPVAITKQTDEVGFQLTKLYKFSWSN